MDPVHVAILVAAGLAGGFIAGLVGVGGGIVFAPVLFFFFQGTGVSPEVIAPLTVGTSLLCTLTVSSMSAWQHHLRHVVEWPISTRVGLLSAAALYLIVEFVTTKPWYDRFAFQLVFGILLLAVAGRMLLERRSEIESDDAPVNPNRRPAAAFAELFGIGSAAGAIAALAGVGGGVVMVPAYNQVLHMSIRRSVGTSSAAIVVISLIGASIYAASGWSSTSAPWVFGYVDIAHGLILAIPGLLGANAGARLAHRLPRRALQIAFAAIACVVAGRMLLSALFN